MRARRWSIAPLMIAALTFGVGCDMDGGGDDNDPPSSTTSTGGGGGTGVLPPQTSGAFTNTGSLSVRRYRHTTTLLTDGRILVAGGRNSAGGALGTAEIFNPSTQTWSYAQGAQQGLSYARFGHSATRLSNGKVLFAGGTNGTATVATAELFDPITNTFSILGTMGTARYNHSAVLLGNGNVHLAGGTTGTNILNTSEIYVASSGQFRNVNNALLQARELHAAIALPNGKILLAGGQAWIGTPAQLLTINDCELFTPGGADGENGIYTITANLPATRAMGVPVRIATGTAQGQVLLIGGYTNNPSIGRFSTIELFDPNAGAAGTWTTVIANMSVNRYAHTATMLPSGKVLIVGGNNANVPEILDPYGQVGAGGVDQTATVTRTMSGALPSTMAGVTTARSWHGAALTGNGLVVLTGGLDGDPTAPSSAATSSVEYHTP